MESNLIWGFILSQLKPFRNHIIAQTALCVVWAVDMSLRPYILKNLINEISNFSSNFEKVALFALLYIALTFCIIVTFRIYDYILIYFNSPLKRNVVEALTDKMLNHSQELFSNNFSGAMANKIKDAASNIPDMVELVLYKFCSFALSIFIAIFAVSSVGVRFSLYLATWVALFIFVSIMMSKKARELCDEAAESKSKVMGLLVDLFSNSSSIRLFSRKMFEKKHLKHSLDFWGNADKARNMQFFKMFLFQGFSFFLYQSICIYFLIKGVSDNSVTAGDFVMVFTINIAVIDVLWNLSTDISHFVDYYGNITQGLNIALKPIDIEDYKDAKPLIIKNASIVFDRVKFHYKGAHALFENKSITIKAGQKIGLVGYSGSGKSTFVNLILRLYDLTDGRILIDNQDIKLCSQDSLRQAIATIPQDPSLFHRTLMENIRYGRIEATDAEVINAAKKAHAHEFISQLSQGYDSPVGEKGVKLSGGQRQRIAIARAILKNAPILILDEATSQLDSVTEKDIQNSLEGLMQSKTTIVIAHRLSTLLNMDRILVFDQGKIIEDGSHAELLAIGGMYKTLWDAQIGGFLPDKKEY